MILFALLAIAVILTTIALVRTIAADGYGIRPAPRSHHDDVPHHRHTYDRTL